jgi:hypothetical protein
MLQRKFKLGYTRAARLIDIMEERGYVGPHDGRRAREVYGNVTDRIAEMSRRPSPAPEDIAPEVAEADDGLEDDEEA